ncbi:hypothetical protein DFH09DRAFT_638029 [Mycena vulgaris]|nr:hypothetical protein DFH09DRAFT_638029 [Mycena vulgaris]
MSTLIVPQGSSYVAAALVSTVFLLFGQTYSVGTRRSRAGIEYPRLYADKEEMAASKAALTFNCAQRAHQNTLETLPLVYMMTLVFATKHPILAASALGMWVVSRIAYTAGYLTGNPANRNNIATSIFFFPSIITLQLGSVYTAYQLVAAGI